RCSHRVERLVLVTVHNQRPCFFFHATAPTYIYTLSLHDALPIFAFLGNRETMVEATRGTRVDFRRLVDAMTSTKLPNYAFRNRGDRKSTRLNSSHRTISYAVFCLKKKKAKPRSQPRRRESCNALY